MTDTMGRIHFDAQFDGSSSVPAHLETVEILWHGEQSDYWGLD
jgi:hypothetical protein